jgi:hypothetical protein
VQKAAMSSGGAGGLTLVWALGLAVSILPPGQARAAVPSGAAACTAASPAAGEVFSGPVLQVIDGRTLCVADGPTPDRWVRVRLSDIPEGRARGALMAAAFAKDVICTADRRDREGVVGRCVFDGAPLGQLVRSDEVRAQAASWR